MGPEAVIAAVVVFALNLVPYSIVGGAQVAVVSTVPIDSILMNVNVDQNNLEVLKIIRMMR